MSSATKHSHPPPDAVDRSGMTPLQQHVAFFDRDQDGVIWPYDTYIGFRELGFGVILAFISAIGINAGFSYLTRFPQHILPDIFLRISVAGIAKAKHGSDTGVFDSEGNFDAEAFDRLFTRFGDPRRHEIAIDGVLALVRADRKRFDLFGQTAAIGEWLFVILLLADNGVVHEDDLRGAYNGSLFFRIASLNRPGQPGWHEGYKLRNLVHDIFRLWLSIVLFPLRLILGHEAPKANQAEHARDSDDERTVVDANSPSPRPRTRIRTKPASAAVAKPDSTVGRASGVSYADALKVNTAHDKGMTGSFGSEAGSGYEAMAQ